MDEADVYTNIKDAELELVFVREGTAVIIIFSIA